MGSFSGMKTAEVSFKADTDIEAQIEAQKNWKQILSKHDKFDAPKFLELVKVHSWKPKN